MSRYFFAVLDSRAAIDTEGEEHLTLKSARDAAVKVAGEILSSEGSTYWQDGKWGMSVTNDVGEIIFTLAFTATSHDELPWRGERLP